MIGMPGFRKAQDDQLGKRSGALTGLFRIPFLADFFVGRAMRDDIELPDYGY